MIVKPMYSICLKVQLPKRVQYVEVQNTEEEKDNAIEFVSVHEIMSVSNECTRLLGRNYKTS